MFTFQTMPLGELTTAQFMATGIADTSAEFVEWGKRFAMQFDLDQLRTDPGVPEGLVQAVRELVECI